MTNASIAAFASPVTVSRSNSGAHSEPLAARLSARWARWQHERRAARERAALHALAGRYEATSPSLAAELRGLARHDAS